MFLASWMTVVVVSVALIGLTHWVLKRNLGIAGRWRPRLFWDLIWFWLSLFVPGFACYLAFLVLIFLFKGAEDVLVPYLPQIVALLLWFPYSIGYWLSSPRPELETTP